MKTRYKIPIIASCIFASWILFPNIPGAICHFAYDEDINGKLTEKPEFCSITGINFFGYPLNTNFFREEIRHELLSECYYENDGEVKIC